MELSVYITHLSYIYMNTKFIVYYSDGSLFHLDFICFIYFFIISVSAVCRFNNVVPNFINMVDRQNGYYINPFLWFIYCIIVTNACGHLFFVSIAISFALSLSLSPSNLVSFPFASPSTCRAITINFIALCVLKSKEVSVLRECRRV